MAALPEEGDEEKEEVAGMGLDEFSLSYYKNQT